jgi:hypothetical protein
MKKTISIALMAITLQATASNYSVVIGVKDKNINFVNKITTPTPPADSGIEGSSSLSKQTINRGETTVISWNYTDIDSITIDGVGTYNQSSGSVNVKPTTSITYSVTIHKGENVKHENLSVDVIQLAPQISLTATSYKIGVGKNAIINWSVTNSDDISISNVGNNLAKSGTYNVSPTTDTTYTLIAKGYEDIPEKTDSITIKVIPNAVINSFDVNNTTFNKGETAIFTWDITNASKITLNGVVIPVATTTSSIKLNTVGTVTYDLEVTSLSGQTTKQTKTLTVNESNMINFFSVNGTETSTVTAVSTLIKFTWDMVTPKTLKITNNRGLSTTLPIASKTYSYTFNHPVGDTIYTLEATNESGEKFTKTVTVKSVSSPVINTVTSMSSIYVGESYTLEWTGTGITRYTLRSDDAGTGIPTTDTEYTSGSSFVVPNPVASNNIISIFLMGYNEAGTSVQKLIRYSVIDSPTIALPTINTNYRNSITVAPNAALTFTVYSMSGGSTLVGRDSSNSYDVAFPTHAPAITGTYEYYMAAYKTVNGVTRYSNLLKATVIVK